MAIQVRAIRDGFFKGGRVRAGAVFEVPEGTKLGKWMEDIALSKRGAAKAAPEEPRTFSEMNKAQTGSSPKQKAVAAALAGKGATKAPVPAVATESEDGDEGLV